VAGNDRGQVGARQCRRGQVIARATHDQIGDARVIPARITPGRIPTDPTGTWVCTTLTEGGQLVGIRKFKVIRKDGTEAPPAPPAGGGSAGSRGSGGGSGSGVGSGSGASSGSGVTGGSGSGVTGGSGGSGSARAPMP